MGPRVWVLIEVTPSSHSVAICLFRDRVITRDRGVILDKQLLISHHTANLTRSCSFLLYNLRSIWPFLPTEATRVLVQCLLILIGLLQLAPSRSAATVGAM